MNQEKEDKNLLRLKKKLEKKTQGIFQGLDVSSQDKAIPLQRVKARTKNTLISKEILSTLGIGILIFIVAYFIYAISTGKILIYDIIQNFFK